MASKVKVRDRETGEVREVYAVDAREMVAQEDGRYEHHKGKKAAKADDAEEAAPAAVQKGKGKNKAAPAAEK